MTLNDRRRVRAMVTAMAVAVALWGAVALPAWAQYPRVSVSTAGVQANGASSAPSISADGRYVAFISEATNLVDNDTNGVADVFLRDRDTDADGIFDEPGAVSTRRLNLNLQGGQADAPALKVILSGHYLAFQSRATNLAPTRPGVLNIFIVDIDNPLPAVDLATMSTDFNPTESDCTEFDFNAIGDSYLLVYLSNSSLLAPGAPGTGGAIFTRTFPERVTRRASPPLTAESDGHVKSPTVDDANLLIGFTIVKGVPSMGNVYRSLRDGTSLQYMGRGVSVTFGPSPGPFFVELVHGTMGSTYARRSQSGYDAPFFLTLQHRGFVLSRDGRFALGFSPSDMFLQDFNSGERTTLPLAGIADWSADGRWIAVETTDASLAANDTNGAADIVVVDLTPLLDTDHDGLDDRWERLSGLSTSDSTGVNGPAGDPDGDGQTNAQEFATWTRSLIDGGMTHPTGTITRYFAEGVSNQFFDTQIDLANPSETTPAAVQLHYRGSGGLATTQQVLVPPRQHRYVLPGGEIEGSFGIEVESNVPVLADRRVSWDRTMAYGAHLETSQPAPAPTWYLTEGTTVLGFNLFYLMLNPNAVTVNATVRFLRPSGPPIVRVYPIAAHARLTVRVNDVDPALAASDVSAEVSGDQPLVVERAMYADRAGQLFGLGTASAGVTAPSTSWFLAEGATGDFFDLYVLIANPGSTDAAVTARFLKPDGSVITKQYTVAASSRFSIFVDAIPGLEGTPVSTEITSTVPVTVERAMYWPGNFFDYYEGHTANGVTATALRWGLAEGESGPNAQSFVLVANPGSTAGQARITLMPEGTTSPTPTVVDLPANSRVTLPIVPTGFSRFGVLVESIGASPVPIVVEGAYYWTVNGQLWSAGGAEVATPLP